MKGASKVIMVATLVMIVSCAVLLGLVLIILAELYCSGWLRRFRKPRLSSSPSSSSSAIPISNAAAATISTTSGQHSLSSFYSQGVMKAPRSLLFPAVEMQKQHSSHSGLFEICGSSTDEEIELETETASIPPSYNRRSVFTLQSSPPMAHLPPPKLVYEISGSSSSNKETYIYICNPMYDRTGGTAAETPFETPESSPSRLESDGSSSSSGEDDKVQDFESPVAVSNSNATPPLTPMKKLPAEAVSVSLRDGGSLATSGSESNSNYEAISSCLSTGTPCTSPSW